MFSIVPNTDQHGRGFIKALLLKDYHKGPTYMCITKLASKVNLCYNEDDLVESNTIVLGRAGVTFTLQKIEFYSNWYS